MKYNQAWKRAYAETVEYAVIAALEAVGESGQFTLKQFAENYGFKLTWNLRRRMAELVERRIVGQAQRYLENGRLGYVYYRVSEDVLPFFDDDAPSASNPPLPY